MYHYKAILIRVIDGDTVELAIDLGFHVFTKQIVRMAGIDTAELNSPDPTTRETAKKARDRILELTSNRDLEVLTYKPDKYGRWLVDILLPNEPSATVNKQLILEGLAKSYTGTGDKPTW